jgi:hypothetical protein
VHPTQIEHGIDLPNQMIRRHYLVQIKRIKELTLPDFPPPHHEPPPSESHHSDGITEPTSLQQTSATKSALSGLVDAIDQCPLCGVKQTLVARPKNVRS